MDRPSDEALLLAARRDAEAFGSSTAVSRHPRFAGEAWRSARVACLGAPRWLRRRGRGEPPRGWRAPNVRIIRTLRARVWRKASFISAYSRQRWTHRASRAPMP